MSAPIDLITAAILAALAAGVTEGLAADLYNAPGQTEAGIPSLSSTTDIDCGCGCRRFGSMYSIVWSRVHKTFLLI
jgi:hypothetical protein